MVWRELVTRGQVIPCTSSLVFTSTSVFRKSKAEMRAWSGGMHAWSGGMHTVKVAGENLPLESSTRNKAANAFHKRGQPMTEY